MNLAVLKGKSEKNINGGMSVGGYVSSRSQELLNKNSSAKCGIPHSKVLIKEAPETPKARQPLHSTVFPLELVSYSVLLKIPPTL